MDAPQRLSEDVESWETMMFLYNSAIKEVGTKLEILNDEFQHVHQYNPIEYIKSRVKTPESICKKLKRYGKEVSIENMVSYVNSICQRHCRNPDCMLVYLGHLPGGGHDWQAERPDRSFRKGLYQASKRQRL